MVSLINLYKGALWDRRIIEICGSLLGFRVFEFKLLRTVELLEKK